MLQRNQTKDLTFYLSVSRFILLTIIVQKQVLNLKHTKINTGKRLHKN